MKTILTLFILDAGKKENKEQNDKEERSVPASHEMFTLFHHNMYI